MKNHLFSSLVSITKGLHRDTRTEREFEQLLSNETKLTPKNAIFKINFKRPLNFKKEYFQRIIFNETSKIISSLKNKFPENASMPENNYSYTLLSNRFNKYLNDIANYINKRNISNEVKEDNDYIINYLKLSAVQLYLELQKQYGDFSTNSKLNFEELMEKYFNETEVGSDLIEKIGRVKPKKTHKTKKVKTSFGYISRDTKKLQTVLNDLQYSFDILNDRTDTEYLYKLLIADNFKNTSNKIYLQCETTQFSYIVRALKPYFSNFTPTAIERSEMFFTKTDTLLKANNLHKNIVHNTKGKETIDNIIKQLQ